MDPIHHSASDLAEKLHLQREFGELRATYRWFSWKRLLIYLPGTILFLFFCGVCIWLGITPPVEPWEMPVYGDHRRGITDCRSVGTVLYHGGSR